MLHFWVLLYMAAIYVRPGEIVPAFGAIPILDYLSAIAAMGAGVSLLLSPRSFWGQPQDKLFLIYWMAVLVSNPAWGWIGGALEALTEFAPVVMCYFLIRLGVRNVAELRRFTRFFVVLNLFLAFNGLLQIYTGAGLGPVAAMETREGVRIQGTGIFNDPNDLGMTLVMTVPFILSAITGRGARFFGRVFGLAALAVILLACYYTNSRGTMLGLAMVLAAFMYRRFGFFSASTLAGIGLAALVALGPSRMATVSAEEASAQGRIQAWAAGYQMFFDSPVIGVGYRRFDDHHGLVAHNAFVHVLAELGLIGALAFVGMFYCSLRGLRRRPESNRQEDLNQQRLRQDLSNSVLGLLACICFLSRQYVVVPFISVALAACYASVTATGDADHQQTLFGNIVPVFVVTAAMIVFFYLISRFLAFY